MNAKRTNVVHENNDQCEPAIMNRNNISIILSALIIAAYAVGVRAESSYSRAVMLLNPVAYWTLDETNTPPPAYMATNSGTLGAMGNGFYNNTYYPNGTNAGYYQKTFFIGPVAGATSDGDAAAQFSGGTNGDDDSGYVIIPDANHVLDTGIVPFTAEVWVLPQGGDPNDPSGTNYASTEWAGIIKKGGGGWNYNDSGDDLGNTYGWSISLAGIYALGATAGWYEAPPAAAQLQSTACWVVDFYNGTNGAVPTLEFDVPLIETTPQWFHLVLEYDGANANFYTNGVLAATTVPGLPQSTNEVFAPGASGGFPTSPTGLYQFSTANGAGYAPDTVNPMVLGNLKLGDSYIDEGYPILFDIGFNCQVFDGIMDEVAVYTNALAATNVIKHYQDATAAIKTQYTNDVLSANPLIYLRFDEPAYAEPGFNTFPQATNYGTMGAAANGRYQPGVTPATVGPLLDGAGTIALAPRLNGLDAAIDVGNGALAGTALDPQGAQPFSVVVWFKGNPADCFGRPQTIIGRGDSGWDITLDASGAVHWNPGNGPDIYAPANYDDGAWHQAIGVSDGSTAYLYVDGTLAASSGGVGSLPGTPYDLLIGGAPDYTTSDLTSSHQRYFAGSVTQVAFFNSALTAGQAELLYPLSVNANLIIENVGGGAVILWTSPTAVLQSAPIVTGPYTDIPDATSPYIPATMTAQQYFRLRTP
jgi:hypothetical protein